MYFVGRFYPIIDEQIQIFSPYRLLIHFSIIEILTKEKKRWNRLIFGLLRESDGICACQSFSLLTNNIIIEKEITAGRKGLLDNNIHASVFDCSVNNVQLTSINVCIDK